MMMLHNCSLYLLKLLFIVIIWLISSLSYEILRSYASRIDLRASSRISEQMANKAVLGIKNAQAQIFFKDFSFVWFRSALKNRKDGHREFYETTFACPVLGI